MREVRIYKFPERKLYVKVPNYAARDPRLSFGAKGLLTYLLSLPENYIIFKKNIIEQQNVTRTLLDNYFNELQSFGYVEVKSQVNEKGKFRNLDYIVYSVPFNDTDRIFQDPSNYPETEEQPMQGNSIGQNDPENDIFDQKPAKQGEFTDAGKLHRPMQSAYIFHGSTPYNDLKEIDNKTSIASQVLKSIYDLRYEFTTDPDTRKRLRIPAETASRVSMIKSRQKEFFQAFGKKDFVAAAAWVFRYKALEWSKDPVMWKYFDPETLLNSENFIKYCEACKRDNGIPPAKPVKKSGVPDTPTVASNPDSYHRPVPQIP